MIPRALVRPTFWMAVALCLSAPGIALAQTLPWQTAPSQPQQPHSNYAPPPHSVQTMPSSTRAQDDRKLDELATKFYAIKAQDPKAVEKLGALLHKVQSFRKELKNRSYDVADISRDTQKLAWRIDSQRKKLKAQQVAGTPATPDAPAIQVPPPTNAVSPAVVPPVPDKK